MSLLNDAMETVAYVNKSVVSDGYGGTKTEWTEGATFQAAITFDTSMQARIAEKQSVTSLYTITTSRDMVLEYHDVLRRQRDGKIFRVTSDGDDKYTPISATLDMRQVTAEEWELPKNG